MNSDETPLKLSAEDLAKIDVALEEVEQGKTMPIEEAFRRARMRTEAWMNAHKGA